MSSMSFRSRALKSCAAAALMAFAAPLAVNAQQQTHQFNIPSQDLAGALRTFAGQSREQVVFDSQAMVGKTSRPIVGAYPADTALNRLLDGSGFVSSRSARGVLMVREAGGSAQGQGDVSSADEETTAVEEIIVTAQKREERLQDVPVPVTALDAGSLVKTNQLRLQDFYTAVPGLNVNAGATQNGAININIRGISSLGNVASPVGFVVDDVPYTAAGQGLGALVYEVDPTDVARVEILRGPQGTLYGANSPGGLIKYVTKAPSLAGFSGLLRAGVHSIHNANLPGYAISGAVNVPLSDTFAVRASLFSRANPGYIDDPKHSREGAGREDAYGGRLAALWAPTDRFSLTLGAVLQNYETNGTLQVSNKAGAGDLEQDDLPGGGRTTRRLEIYTANVRAKLGPADLDWITAYSKVDHVGFQDANPGGAASGNGGLANLVYGTVSAPVTGALNLQPVRSNRLTQEIRVNVPIGDNLDWLVGAFYADEDKDVPSRLFGANYQSGQIVGVVANFDVASKYKEYAVFTDLTAQLGDRLEVQLGLRQSWYDTKFFGASNGPLFTRLGLAESTFSTPVEDNALTYLATAKYRFSPQVMAYARVATGFRVGGGNNRSAEARAPEGYEPDEVTNYEVGLKGSFLDNKLTFDASAYFIEWDNIQLSVFPAGFLAAYATNAAKAESKGIELAFSARPWEGFTVSGWGAYNDASLAAPLPTTAVGLFGKKGDPLPFTPEWSGQLSLEQQFQLFGDTGAYVSASLSYQGERTAGFAANATSVPDRVDGYTKLDLRAGATFGSVDVEFFVNNATDERAILFRTLTFGTDVIIQPRTVGVTLTAHF